MSLFRNKQASFDPFAEESFYCDPSLLDSMDDASNDIRGVKYNTILHSNQFPSDTSLFGKPSNMGKVPLNSLEELFGPPDKVKTALDVLLGFLLGRLSPDHDSALSVSSMHCNPSEGSQRPITPTIESAKQDSDTHTESKPQPQPKMSAEAQAFVPNSQCPTQPTSNINSTLWKNPLAWQLPSQGSTFTSLAPFNANNDPQWPAKQILLDVARNTRSVSKRTRQQAEQQIYLKDLAGFTTWCQQHGICLPPVSIYQGILQAR